MLGLKHKGMNVSPIHLFNCHKFQLSWIVITMLITLIIVMKGHAQQNIDNQTLPNYNSVHFADIEVEADSKVLASLIFDVTQFCDGEYYKEVRPYHFQLYPRNADNMGRVLIAGSVIGSQKITFRVEKLDFDHNLTTAFHQLALSPNGRFSLEIYIHAELAEYRFSYSFDGDTWHVLADHVVCGDVFLVSGQSNASADSDVVNNARMNLLYGNEESNKFGKYSRTITRWEIHSANAWGYSQVSAAYGVGVWGLRLQYELQKSNGVPTCLINGAVGGTGMHKHHLHATKPFYYTYSPDQYLMGSLLTRVYYAGLENHIRAIIWYNGEDECGASTPETGIYTRDFDGLYQSCLAYLGSFRQMYVVQVASFIGPRTGIGFVSEDQRNLPLNYEKLKVMSSNGIGPKNPAPGQDIHFSAIAYAELGRRLFNLIQRDIYANFGTLNPEPLNILKARSEDNRIYLDFNQWIDISLSDALEDILSVVTFNLPDVAKYNPGIEGNSFYFDVDPAVIPLIQEVSYAGYLPNGQYDLKCYLRNADGVGALSFYKMAITLGGNPYGIDLISGKPLEVKLYPNPVKGITRISISGEACETRIQMFKLTGELILQQIGTAETFNLDCTKVPAGIYFVRISNKSGTVNKKVVVL